METNTFLLLKHPVYGTLFQKPEQMHTVYLSSFHFERRKLRHKGWVIPRSHWTRKWCGLELVQRLPSWAHTLHLHMSPPVVRKSQGHEPGHRWQEVGGESCESCAQGRSPGPVQMEQMRREQVFKEVPWLSRGVKSQTWLKWLSSSSKSRYYCNWRMVLSITRVISVFQAIWGS